MRLKTCVSVMTCVMFLGFGAAARADVIDFESGLDGLFTYAAVSAYSDGCSSCLPGTGYQQILDATGSQGAVFNPFAQSPSDFLWNGPGTFDLTSFLIAGAWGDQNLTIEGWNNGALLYSAILPVTTTPETFLPNWHGLDQLRIVIDPAGYTQTVFEGGGQHWALDNLTVNESVPEPASILLLGGGLLAVARRRRA